MATFVEIKNALDEIAQVTTRAGDRVGRAKSQINEAQTTLAAMPSTYLDIITAINDGATANPSDAAWQNAKAEKDLMVADFQALKAEVDALVTAIEGA